MKIHPATITKAINRFARAVEDKAFEGTIPFDSDRALEAHYQIDVEFIKSPGSA